VARNAVIRIYDLEGYLVKHVTRREAGELVKSGDWDQVMWRGRFWGLQRVPKQSGPSSPVLTPADMLANARITKGDIGNPAPDENRIKVAQDKVGAWPFEYDRRAPVISAGRVHGVTEHVEESEFIRYCAWPKWDETAERLAELRRLAPSEG
jgi:hypothetical protein